MRKRRASQTTPGREERPQIPVGERDRGRPPPGQGVAGIGVVDPDLAREQQAKQRVRGQDQQPRQGATVIPPRVSVRTPRAAGAPICAAAIRPARRPAGRRAARTTAAVSPCTRCVTAAPAMIVISNSAAYVVSRGTSRATPPTASSTPMTMIEAVGVSPSCEVACPAGIRKASALRPARTGDRRESATPT